MDFSTWSPSYTMMAIFVTVAFIGQIAVFLYCTGRIGKTTEQAIGRFTAVTQPVGRSDR